MGRHYKRFLKKSILMSLIIAGLQALALVMRRKFTSSLGIAMIGQKHMHNHHLSNVMIITPYQFTITSTQRLLNLMTKKAQFSFMSLVG